LKGLDQLDWLPPFRSCVTAIVGRDANHVRLLALGVGAAKVPEPLDSMLGGDLFFRIGRMGGREAPPMPDKQFGLSFLNDGASFLSMLRLLLEHLRDAQMSPRRVLVGDLRDLRYHTNPQDIVSAISVAAALLRDLRIPLVLFDTLEDLGSSSAALSLADVSITWGVQDKTQIRVENLFTGQGKSIPGGLQGLIPAE
jgi:hypothetical protein